MTPVRDVAWDPMPDAKAWWNRAAQRRQLEIGAGPGA
jgi:hypothetical protein